MSSDSHSLPPREAALYKKLLKHYREKQYKMGLKLANQILTNPKHSEHGETLSMKGLILNSFGKKAEALDFARRGLKNDVRSHVCWHVFGVLQKNEHKYEDSIKSFRNALRLKKDSIQILSDLSLVQMQTRDLEGYRDSRHQLFLLRPSERATWLGCALAYHLTGDHITAVNLINEYLKSTNTKMEQEQFEEHSRRAAAKMYEQSELLLYYISILLECKRYEEALQQLHLHESEIVDKVAFFEYQAEIFLQLGRTKQAESIILEQLLTRNPENSKYCEMIERTQSPEMSEEGRIKLYNQMAEKFPRSQTILREPLNFVSDLKIFRSKMAHYLKKGFRKGRPALFRDLKYIYNTELAQQAKSFAYSRVELTSMPANLVELRALITKQRRIVLPPKIEIIENLLLGYVEHLRVKDSFEADGAFDEEAVTCLLWVYYFLAQHFDALKEFSLALHFANLALLHTPTLLDVFVIKAKIFKHAGFPEKAVKFVEEAQSLDTSDRYLNSKCAKYLIRINKLKEAEEMCLKFTREGVLASDNLNEMQCMWFQTTMALSYQATGQWGEALKKCVEIDNHFAEINEDQYDFNSYCILKATLRSYVKLVRLEDRLKAHAFFFRAAKIAIEIYLSLYDKPASLQSETGDDENAKLSASELKKLRNKQRKAQLKATEKEKAAERKGNDKKVDPEAKSEPTVVIDPMELQKTTDPLGAAMRFLAPLKIFAADKIETQLLAFEVYYRKGKVLLMLQSLKRGYQICSKSLPASPSKHWPVLLGQFTLFLDFIESRKEQLNQTIRTVVGEQLSMLPLFNKNNQTNGGDVAFNQLPISKNFCEEHISIDSKSFATRLQRLLVHQMIEQQTKRSTGVDGQSLPLEGATDFVKGALEKIIAEIDQLQDVNLDSTTKLYRLVSKNEFGKVDQSLVDRLRVKLHQLFPYASLFMTEAEIEEIEKELSATDYFTAEVEEANGNTV